MIVDGILWVVKSLVGVLLAPLEIINIGVDLLSGSAVFVSFLQVVAYIIPWVNILPIIFIIISSFMLRILISLLKTVWGILPIA